MTIKLSMPVSEQQLKPRITVIGVGGAGGNAVNNMISSSLEGVEFLVCNTDSQALDQSIAENKLQLGVSITQGLGAGARPEVGQAAAEEVLDTILDQVIGSHMCFVTAGMGGGTGTGAAPVIARAARENGMLTVGVVTKPFHFEGAQRMRTAEEGIEELAQYVDTLIIIPNQNLFRIANEKTTFAEAFNMADEVLNSGVRGVTDLMVMPGLINLDFADIRTVMSEMGKAMMGTGEAEGESRAIDAAESAISNPLLDDITMEGAKGVLINITGGPDITLFEVDEAANRIRQEVDDNANILFGSTFEDTMEGKIRVSVVATGIDAHSSAQTLPQPRPIVEENERSNPSRAFEENGTSIVEPTPIELAVEAAKKLDSNEASHLEEVAKPIEQSEKDEGSQSSPTSTPENVEIRQDLANSESMIRDPFIPPQPVDVGISLSRENELDPFSEADFTNAQSVKDPSRKRKRPSLFKRLTGAAKREEESERLAMAAKLNSQNAKKTARKPISSKAANPYATSTQDSATEPAVSAPRLKPTTEAPPHLKSSPVPEMQVEEISVTTAEPEIKAEQSLPPSPVSSPQKVPASTPVISSQDKSMTEAAPTDQFSLSQAETEMLEIPAFLRRQAN